MPQHTTAFEKGVLEHPFVVVVVQLICLAVGLGMLGLCITCYYSFLGLDSLSDSRRRCIIVVCSLPDMALTHRQYRRYTRFEGRESAEEDDVTENLLGAEENPLYEDE